MVRICAFLHCNISSTPKYEGQQHKWFQIPTRISEYYDYVGWAKKLADIVKRYRDQEREDRVGGGLTFKEKLSKGQVHMLSTFCI